MKRVFGCATIGSPIAPPEPGTKLTTPAGRPVSASSSTKAAAITGASLDGLRTTVLPATSAAVVMPAMIANAKFHGGITTPTPSGM